MKNDKKEQVSLHKVFGNCLFSRISSIKKNVDYGKESLLVQAHLGRGRMEIPSLSSKLEYGKNKYLLKSLFFLEQDDSTISIYTPLPLLIQSKLEHNLSLYKSPVLIESFFNILNLQKHFKCLQGLYFMLDGWVMHELFLEIYEMVFYIYLFDYFIFYID